MFKIDVKFQKSGIGIKIDIGIDIDIKIGIRIGIGIGIGIEIGIVNKKRNLPRLIFSIVVAATFEFTELHFHWKGESFSTIVFPCVIKSGNREIEKSENRTPMANVKLMKEKLGETK